MVVLRMDDKQCTHSSTGFRLRLSHSLSPLAYGSETFALFKKPIELRTPSNDPPQPPRDIDGRRPSNALVANGPQPQDDIAGRRLAGIFEALGVATIDGHRLILRHRQCGVEHQRGGEGHGQASAARTIAEIDHSLEGSASHRQLSRAIRRGIVMRTDSRQGHPEVLHTRAALHAATAVLVRPAADYCGTSSCRRYSLRFMARYSPCSIS